MTEEVVKEVKQEEKKEINIENSGWLKKHTDTLLILSALFGVFLWIDGKFNIINQKFDVVNTRFNTIDTRINSIENRLTAIETVLMCKNIMPMQVASTERDK